MKQNKYFLLVFWLFLACQSYGQGTLKTSSFKMSIGPSGQITSLYAIPTNKEYLPSGQQPFLLSLKVGDKIIPPNKMQQSGNTISLSYPYKNTVAQVKVQQKSDYLTFELVSITNLKDIDLVLWGPYPTTINKTIGETVGVVRDGSYAIGIQALNLKTLGGYPTYDNDIDPNYEAKVNGTTIRFRGQTAKPADFGSVLQAYCRNRFKDRVILNWAQPQYDVPAYPQDGGVINSKIALFGVPVQQTLNTISHIETGENLPHPAINGQWLKTSPAATASYLIIDYNEQSIDEALQYTQQAGLRYLYSFNPFVQNGHMRLVQKDFPDNWATLQKLVARAKQKNINLGLHVLSNFISPGDPYVTPVPDKGLSKVGYSQLTSGIDAKTDKITLKDTEVFQPRKYNVLRAAVIGNEIITYKTVAGNTLQGCTRGAYGTSASSHAAGDAIGLLADHEYKVFLGDINLQQKMAAMVADFCNQTGIMQLSFDGIEGCQSSGMGQYAMHKFVDTWYQRLNPALKGKIINDASNPTHYLWHTATRMNWGEPWYGSFRASQLGSRLENQAYYDRNYFPHMLGWFKLSSDMSVSDLEWMLAKSAGYNGGFGFVTSMDILRNHPQKNEILQTIKNWEDARMKGLFKPAIRQQLTDAKKEYHLDVKNGRYTLISSSTQSFTTGAGKAAPKEASAAKTMAMSRTAAPGGGELIDTTISFNNPFGEQVPRFTLRLVSASPNAQMVNATVMINKETVTLPVTITPQQLVTFNGQQLQVLDASQKVVNSVQLPPTLQVKNGQNSIRLSGAVRNAADASVSVDIRSNGTSIAL